MTLLISDKGIPEINRHFTYATRDVVFFTSIISLLTNRPARCNTQLLYVFRLPRKKPSPRHKSIEESGLIASPFLNLDAVLDEWSALLSDHITPKKKNPVTHWIRVLVGPRSDQSSIAQGSDCDLNSLAYHFSGGGTTLHSLFPCADCSKLDVRNWRPFRTDNCVCVYVKCLPRKHVAFSYLTQMAALFQKVCHLQDKYVIKFTVLLEKFEKDIEVESS
jgi:hypothetical protein